MTGSAHTFAVLPFVLLLWIMAWSLRSRVQRQGFLLIASYLFYGSLEQFFILILIGSSIMNFYLGAWLRRRREPARLWVGIAANLLLLSFFKYLPPLANGPLSEILMPVGISFWTFQGLSYLVDVYREEGIEPTLLEFCLYMAFWPTVLSGPICRLSELLPQLRVIRGLTPEDVAAGLMRILQGLIMKFVLAQLLIDGIGIGAGIDAGFRMKSGWSALDVWLLAFGYGFQLFFDFAGYSHIMIGIARLFGVRLQENFQRPYLSVTPSVFWTRWHMSLSSWIRDYVFLPIAAVRRDRWWLYLTLVISMTLFGLWHAAQATFLVWGLYQGLLLVAHRVGQQWKRTLPTVLRQPFGAAVSWLATFCAIMLGWILFRANTLDQAFMMFDSIVTPSQYTRRSLPLSLYGLVASLMTGYFAVQCFITWMSKLSEQREPTNVQRIGAVAADLRQLLGVRVWWWLTPMSVVAVGIAWIVIGDQSKVVAPFAYTLF